jgi:hypothetical protein
MDNIIGKEAITMFKESIVTSGKTSEKISRKIEQITLNSVRKVLPDKVIEQACQANGYVYRAPISYVLTTLWGQL